MLLNYFITTSNKKAIAENGLIRMAVVWLRLFIVMAVVGSMLYAGFSLFKRGLEQDTWLMDYYQPAGNTGLPELLSVAVPVANQPILLAGNRQPFFALSTVFIPTTSVFRNHQISMHYSVTGNAQPVDAAEALYGYPDTSVLYPVMAGSADTSQPADTTTYSRRIKL